MSRYNTVSKAKQNLEAGREGVVIAAPQPDSAECIQQAWDDLWVKRIYLEDGTPIPTTSFRILLVFIV